MSGRDAAGGGLITWATPVRSKKIAPSCGLPRRRCATGQNAAKMVRIGHDRSHPLDDAPQPARRPGRGRALSGAAARRARRKRGRPLTLQAAAGADRAAAGRAGDADRVADRARQRRRAAASGAATSWRSRFENGLPGPGGAELARHRRRRRRRTAAGAAAGRRRAASDAFSVAAASCRHLPVRPPPARRRPQRARAGAAAGRAARPSRSRSIATRCC